MRVLLVAILSVMVFVGCDRSEVVNIKSSNKTEVVNTSPTKSSDVILTDVTGKKYRLVSEEKRISDSVVQSEVWERIEPKDTNHWYARTLGSKLNTNDAPMFNSFKK